MNYTVNDIWCYMSEVGSKDPNFQLNLCKHSLNARLPENWQSNVVIVTHVYTIMDMFMIVNPNDGWCSLKDFTSHTIDCLYNPICVEI